MPTLNLQNAIFKNNGNLEFTKLKTSLNKTYSNGAAYSDLDKDGDLDLVVNNINSTVTLLENTTTNSNYANITLVGDAKYSNTNGAKVYLHTGNKTLYKEQTTVRGFMSSSTKQLHFGLGKQTKIDSITVIWPDATKSTTTNVASNVHVVIKKTNTTAYKYKK
jgi:ASPIC and UnbV.